MREDFQKIQLDEVSDDLDRSQDAFNSQLEQLGRQTQDWACWDDTYKYVVDKNSTYQQTNLRDSFFDTSHLDYVCLLNTQGQIVFGRMRTTGGQIHDLKPSDDFHELAVGSAQRPGPSRDAKATFKGVIQFAHTPMAVLGRAILDGEQKQPTHGTLIMGRFLTDAVLGQIKKANRIDFRVWPIGSELPAGVAEHLANSKTYIPPIASKQDLSGYAYLRGPDNKVSYLLASLTPPDILDYSEGSLSTFIHFVIGGTVLFIGAILLLTRWLVTRPLDRLAVAVNGISNTGDLNTELTCTSRSDEIGQLARDFTDMLERLQDLQRELLTTSREAGMSEVARSVLHNAGNVMNSVTVALHQCEQVALQESHTKLAKICSLLEEQPNLGEFFSNDPKGKQVLPYLQQVLDLLNKDHKELTHEFTVLRTNVTHMNEIVQSQHTFAQKQNLTESIKVCTVLGQAILMLKDAFGRHGVQVHMNCVDAPMITSDPTRLSQIIVNLLTNAKDALKDNPADDRHITISAQLSEDQQFVEVIVADNGMGIAPENLTSIFRGGYTTKLGGLGHGLHYSANTASELGGKLRADSKGVGLGAQFILSLPIATKQKEAA